MTIKLCILQAGDHSSAIPADIPRYRALFTDMFAPFDDIECGFADVRQNESPGNLDDWDAFLVTGSAAGVYDDHDWLPGLRALIHDIAASGKPLVGICFGHQIIADTLGGKAAASDKGWGLGRREIALDNPPESFRSRDNLALLYVHRDQVMEPPTGARVFAGDAFCPIAGYVVDNSILGLQGHPEFTPEVLDAIMELRKTDMGEAEVAQARTDLDAANDAASATAAIVDFIRAGSNHQAA